MHSAHTDYRPDIDGLRALAVMLVLLFHFDLGVPGGFVGVDVFFVISGYLITTIIKNSLARGTFSPIGFYTRRLMRLHPALLVTAAGCLAAGFVLLDPGTYTRLATAANYSIFASSNFYFWSQQGYFDTSAAIQPLLHTWSLAVEWQFYLVWPLIVWMSVKVSDRCLLVVLAFLTLTSLIMSQVMLNRDASAAYFMMPFRGFELSVGALMVFASKRRAGKTIEGILAISGLLLILASAFYLDSGSAFPGLFALAPCLGAAACIYAGQSPWVSVLRLRPAIWIGLVSYSLYLVHWPVIVFYKYYVYRPITLCEKIALLTASFILGAILYRYIERRFMGIDARSRMTAAVAAPASVALLVGLSLLVVEQGGLPSRVPSQYLAFASDPVNFHINNYGGHGYNLSTRLGDRNAKPLAVMAGDSFALQYASGLDEELNKQRASIDGVFMHGCLFSKHYTRLLNNIPRTDCKEAYLEALALLNNNDTPFILAHSWDGYSNIIADPDGNNPEHSGDMNYFQIIEDLLERARKDIGDRPFYIVGSQPFKYENMNVVSCLLRPRYIDQGCETQLKFRLEDSSPYAVNQVIRRFADRHPNVFYIDAAPALCIKGVCHTVKDGKILYSDTNHLSIDGSSIAAKELLLAISER